MDQPHHGHAVEGQRERIAAQLNGGGQTETTVYEETQPEPAAVRARSAFSGQVQETRRQLEAPKGEADQMAQEVDRAADVLNDGKPATRVRSRAPKPTQAPELTPFVNSALMGARVEVLKLVFGSAGDTGLEDGLEMAKSLMEFVES